MGSGPGARRNAWRDQKGLRYFSGALAAPSGSGKKARNRDRASGRGRRPQEPFPVLPWAVGGGFAVVIIALLVALKLATTTFLPSPIEGVQCQSGTPTAVTYHSHLTMIYEGTTATLPAQVGIESKCSFWLRTHDTTGVIYVQAPASETNHQFTLGNFFAVWKQPLNGRQVATMNVSHGQTLKVWVDGQPYSGNPAAIVLKSHEQIVLEIGPPYVEPPPSFNWPASLPT